MNVLGWAHFPSFSFFTQVKPVQSEDQTVYPLDHSEDATNLPPRPRRETGFSVNGSRIGNRGGLRTFTEAVLESLSRNYRDVDAILPRGISAPAAMKTEELPGWLGSSSGISRLRPLLWMMYSTLMFPVQRSRRVLSTTHHVLPFRARQIVTVHDLRPYYEPDTWLQKVYFHILLPRGLRRCDGILTVSNTSKQSIISAYGVEAQKIHVVPNPIALPNPAQPSVIVKKEPEQPYLLMVGASWKHKNAIELLDVNHLWNSRYRLKIVAGKGKYRDRLKDRAALHGISERVDFTEEVTNTRLNELYRGCEALVYPSRMEGFGIPPLEAMAHGKPAIVSDIPVFRELYGNVPFYVELGNLISWRNAFDEIDHSRRASNEWRRQAGIDLAHSFSAEQMSNALVLALELIWDIRPHPSVHLLNSLDRSAPSSQENV